jgi:hypothetical protein
MLKRVWYGGFRRRTPIVHCIHALVTAMGTAANAPRHSRAMKLTT